MCGYIGNVTDSPLVRALMIIIGMEDSLPRLRYNPGSGPASSIDIILQDDGGRRIQQATWWLLLEVKEGGGFRPSRYTSFNTRSDKLDQKHSAGYAPFRTSRCIVPATYYIEGEGPKGARRYHRVEPSETAFALGGIYRTWLDRETGELTWSCSVITLPPHPDARWRRIHTQSTPLMLPVNDAELIDRWLDPGFDRVELFAPLLEPRFPVEVRCVPVESPGNQREVGEAVVIGANDFRLFGMESR